MSANPVLSVVMPVRNEEAHIEPLLGQLLDQSLDNSRYEILVVDGRSEDKTREVVRRLQTEHANLQLLDNPDCLASCARNIGARAARGDFVIFVDGHCQILHNDMLEMVLQAHQRGEKCISRPQPLVPDSLGGFAEATTLARRSLIGHYTGSKIYSHKDRHCSPLTAGCGYNRDFFWELGGLDEDFDAAEDLEFNYRVRALGVEAFHSEKFTICYSPRTTPLGLFRQLYRYGYGRARMTRKHPFAFSPLPTLLGLLGLWFLLGLVLAVVFPGLTKIYLATLLPYAAVTALTSAWMARGRSPWFWLKTWSAFPVIHFGAGLGYLVGLLRGPDWRQQPADQPFDT